METHHRAFTHRILAGVSGLCLFVALMVGAPQPSQAIPSPGDYEFTGDLSGTFSVAGSSLSAWHFTDPFSSVTWDSSDVIQGVINNTSSLFTAVLLPSNQIDIAWLVGTLRVTIGPLEHGGTFGFRSASVPEPMTFWPLALGLLAVLGYDCYQRRQAGVQLG